MIDDKQQQKKNNLVTNWPTTWSSIIILRLEVEVKDQDKKVLLVEIFWVWTRQVRITKIKLFSGSVVDQVRVVMSKVTQVS